MFYKQCDTFFWKKNETYNNFCLINVFEQLIHFTEKNKGNEKGRYEKEGITKLSILNFTE